MPAIIRCDGRHPLSGYAASPSLSGRGDGTLGAGRPFLGASTPGMPVSTSRMGRHTEETAI
ncbi:hypothetical protein F3K36_19710 [Delftia sp. BR1]|nr:hypothetical protein F3K36_19710 [Delftia sp. BR1]